MNIKTVFFSALLLLMPLLSTAQLCGQRVCNHSLEVSELSGFNFTQPVSEASYYGGALHITAGDMLFQAKDRDGVLALPDVDTAFASIDPHISFIAIHSQSDRLYFTKLDSKGRCYLYERYEKKPGKYAQKRVKPQGFSFIVDHPVFSPDGRVMVFSSDCPLGFGGRDLWYSEWKNGEWQYPQNMGSRINSEGDELYPSMYGDFLVFSSNGRGDSYGGFDLYVSRLVALEQKGDTVTMYPIGRSVVQNLQAPFCSESDDLLFITRSDLRSGWWFSRDKEGRERLSSFRGRLDCVALSGVVKSAEGSIIPNATVHVNGGGKDWVVETDKEGRYTLLMQPDTRYLLEYSAPDHFIFRHEIASMRKGEHQLYYFAGKDVTLNAFSLNTPYRFPDMFASEVAVELAPEGRARMDLIARFLVENPDLTLSINSGYSNNADIAFCTLLNQARLNSMVSYLAANGVSSLRIVVSDDVIATQTTDLDADQSSDSISGWPADDVSSTGNAISNSSMTVSFMFCK